MRRLLRSLAAILIVAVVAPASASAIVEQPFAARYTASEPGAIWVTGNALMTCPAAAVTCAASQAGTATGAALNNNGFAMEPVDIDGDPSTFSSSNSTFAPPAAFDVLFAGLYFGGRVTAGTGGLPAPNAAARGSALLRTPATGAAYVPVTGAIADSAAVAGAYVSFADVTALVAAGGAGRYWVANVQSGTGLDRYAGWSLVIVYRDPAQPLRNLTVFDGLAAIQQGDPALSIGVSGFRTPLAGPVRTSVGIVAYEGDRGSAGDRLALNGQLLGDAANPTINLFNSSVSFEGTNTVGARTPGYVNQLGFDADRMVADGLIGNGATSATLEASTTLDQYLIQAVTFTTDLSTPRLQVGKSVADLDGGAVEPGDVLRYTVTALNTGDDGATGVRIADAVPAGATLVPGSLSGAGASAAGDGRSVAFDVGALGPGAAATVAFTVTVAAGAPNGFVVRNTATASGLGATVPRPVSAVSPEVTSVVRRPAAPPLDVDMTVTPQTPVAGEPAEARLTITSALDRTVKNVVVTISVPGAKLLTARAGKGRKCTVRRVVRCAIATLAPGGRASLYVRFQALRPGVLRPVVTVRGDGVAARRVTVRAVRVRPGPARLTVRKRANAVFAVSGEVVRYRLAVTAAITGVPARRVRLCDDPGTGLRLLTVPRSALSACWQLGTIAAGRTVTRTAVARVEARNGFVRNVARVSASNVRAGAWRTSASSLRVLAATPPAVCAADVGPPPQAAC